MGVRYQLLVVLSKMLSDERFGSTRSMNLVILQRNMIMDMSGTRLFDFLLRKTSLFCLIMYIYIR